MPDDNPVWDSNDVATPRRGPRSTTSLYVRIATDRETSYSGLPIGSQLASGRIVYSRAADNARARVCIQVCIISIYTLRRNTRASTISARMLIQSNQPNAHSKKPAVTNKSFKRGSISRITRKKESTRRDQLFRDRRYIFSQ